MLTLNSIDTQTCSRFFFFFFIKNRLYKTEDGKVNTDLLQAVCVDIEADSRDKDINII